MLSGYTYMHEHVAIDLSNLKSDDSRLDCIEDTIGEFKYLKSLGVGNVLEVTNTGMGRDVPYMERVRAESGINLIYCTGFYQEMFHPPYLREWSEDDIYQFLIKELVQGMDGTGIRAQVIGEIGSSENVFTETEQKLFQASIRAHLDTGAPISTHCSLGTLGHEQIKLFQEYTKDLSHIIIGHTDLTGSEPYLEHMLQQGATIAFDTIGKNNYMPDTWRADTLHSLINKGYQGQIVLSMDITRKSHFKARGGIGYAYLIETFLPMLKERGVTQDAIDDMLIHNPQRLLSD